MRTLLTTLRRFAKFLLVLLLSPVLILIAAAALAAADLIGSFQKKELPPSRRPSNRAATVVIPNWNGLDLLKKYLPSVIEALAGHPANEIIVVDNGSQDGSAEFLHDHFPSVHVLALDRNLGFGGGSNEGFRAAQNDIVVLLNSDMRVQPDFLAPLLETFSDADVFAVSCQIFFSDPQKVREETGLTEGWWENGCLRVRHRDDPSIRVPFPCFYGGGGSCAIDRRKFLELGGFDELLRPFYLEDTDLGYQAWKRGWKILYQPRSVVYHEHRGTIGKHFSGSAIDLVLKKNYILFCWKNIHEWRRLASHFFFLFATGLLSALVGNSPDRANFAGLCRAFLQLPSALHSRTRARALATISDTEALRRPRAGYFRDRFVPKPNQPERLSVLLVSPYPICPPVHGGGVFIYQTTTELASRCSLHLIILLDHDYEREQHSELEQKAASVSYLVRVPHGKKKGLGWLLPHAVCEFWNPDLEALLHRQIYLHAVDVLQLEYTALSQYFADFRQIACVLFEHDIYFQSVGRGLKHNRSIVRRSKAAFEYLRALRYELGILPKFDRVQICGPRNRDYLLSFLPGLRGKLDDNRAGIATSRYDFQTERREPYTMLFLGSFRHRPNQQALRWFTGNVLPAVLNRCPEARLVIVGAEPLPRYFLPDLPGIEFRGFVEDVREPLARYAVFVCPILSGSGMRVKLLEAFAAGMPAVSTTLGAEGLADKDGDICALADQPDDFAAKIIELFSDAQKARALACRARERVVATRDMAMLTAKLVESYRAVLHEKRKSLPFTFAAPE